MTEGPIGGPVSDWIKEPAMGWELQIETPSCRHVSIDKCNCR